MSRRPGRLTGAIRLPQPQRPLRFGEFVAMLAMLFSTIAFSIDAMLPALTVIAAELSPDAVNRAQLVVTSFVMGMAVGTLFSGPVSDSFGRKSIVIAGVAIYCAAAIVAAAAQSLEVLLAARFVQGLGASAPRIVTLAMVRDLYQGRRMAQVTSIVMTIFILVPAVAPSIGAGIIALAGWRWVFYAFVAFGILSGGWLMLRQPETLPPERRRPLRLRVLGAAVVEVLTTRPVPLYIAALTLGFAQMFIVLSTVPQLFEDVFDRGASFPYWFAVAAIVAAPAGLVNAALVMRLGMRFLATLAYGLQAGLSAAFLLIWFGLAPAEPWGFALFFAYMCSVFFMIGLTFGNLNALALEHLGHIAGLAAATVGALSSFGAVLVAVPVGLAYDGTPLALGAGVMGCSAMAVALLLRARRIRTSEAARTAPTDRPPGAQPPG